MAYTIRPLHLGDITRPDSGIVYGASPDKKVDFALLSYYLTDGKHKIIVDTGGTPPECAASGPHHPYVRPESQTMEAQLAAIGVRPEDIDTVLFTHLHWDHAGHNEIFTNAVFYAQKIEAEFAKDPVPSQRKAYHPDIVFKTDYRLLDGDVQVLDGISVLLTPGHTAGSQTILVDTDDGIYALTGDLVNTFACWTAHPPIEAAIHTTLEACRESMEKVRRVTDKVLPSHDARVLDHDIYPSIERREKSE